ncbi:MAG: DUF952 domain-containing protein [Pseudomonadota bacterium]
MSSTSLLLTDCVYRLTPPRGWKMALASSFLPYNEDDERDGFFHLSSAEQVLNTAQKYYSSYDELLALEIDEKSLGEELKWEASLGGNIYPHYYGFLPTDKVRRTLSVVKNDKGVFEIQGEAP